MIRWIFLFLTLLSIQTPYAQGEQTFVVKKKDAPSHEKTPDTKIYKLNLFVSIDTIYSGGLYDFSAALGWYDSIATLGMKHTLYQNGRVIALLPDNQRWEGTAMLKLFKKDDYGVMQLIYVKNFFIRGHKK